MSLRILSQSSLCKALLLHLVLWNLSETRTTSLSIGFLSCRVQKLLWLARMDYSVSLVHAPFKLLPQSSSLGNDLIRLYGGLLSYGSNLPRDLAASAFELLTLRKRMRLGSGKARTRTALEFMKDVRRAIIPDEDADFSPIWHKLEPKHRSTDEEALIVGRDLLSPRHFVPNGFATVTLFDEPKRHCSDSLSPPSNSGYFFCECDLSPDSIISPAQIEQRNIL
ncbi:hypothetical protein EV361DRAFT_870242 [Lentinula raphanica]|nr:hypothetical protein EV361DRAFT_870242 [Lentinula raphanica]